MEKQLEQSNCSSVDLQYDGDLDAGRNVYWHRPTIHRLNREALNGHRAGLIWFTGLSGSGKSTLAHLVEAKLHRLGVRTYVLDGDNVRHALCRDLGFTPVDRRENIRRIGEVARLFLDAGIVVLASFISPYRDDRGYVREMIYQGDFLEIYCRCPLETCERRDVKGLYRRARAGEIHEFTGVSAPYEAPTNAELIVDTTQRLELCVQKVMSVLDAYHFLPSGNNRAS